MTSRAGSRVFLNTNETFRSFFKNELHEKPGILFNIFNYSFIFVLCLIPFFFAEKVIKASKPAKRVKEKATTASALEIIYKFNNGVSNYERGLFKKLLTRYLLNINNAKAVRNRLRLTKKAILDGILEHKGESSIRILSLGSGSARAVLEVVRSVEEFFNFEIILVDFDEEALEASRDLAHELDIHSKITWKREKLEGYLNSQNSTRFHLIEMVGILDYLDHERAVKIIKDIYRVLLNKGFFITANIDKNFEKRFLDRVVRWPMIYRSKKQLFSLIKDSPFDEKCAIIKSEPLSIHHLLIAQKL